MTRVMFILSLLLILSVLGISPLKAQDSLQVKKESPGFVDKDGDGYNDNAPDHDGDGIPNVIDSDWQTLQSGKKKKTLDYIDLNGNGINDYVEFAGEEEHSGQQGFGKNQGESGQTPGQGEGSKNLDQNRKGKGGKKK